MKKVLFVCTLNVLRSLMAETITNEVYGKDYAASSAGLEAKDGLPMCYDARAALLRAGYDEKTVLSKRSHTLNAAMMKENDIIVGVTEKHARALRERFPKYASKVTTFPVDVIVPSSGDERGFDECFMTLCEGIEKLFYSGTKKWKPK